jgi:uncharacterized RDD family membrane protein YckC
MSNGQMQYAGFWRRWAAYTIDSVILGYVANSAYWFFMNQLRTQRGMMRSNAEDIAQIYLVVLGFSLTWAYFAGMESSPLRATVGKLAVGLFVTRANGERISFGQATGRFFGKIISSLILYIGFLMASWTARKQAPHDMMAGTLVLRK